METFKIIDPYENYEPILQPDASGVYGNDLLGRVQSLQVGFGSKVLRVDRDGLWLGSDQFADAPFKVDMQGNITASSLSLPYVPIGGALSDVGVGNITGTYIANGAITTAKLTATAIDGMTITGALIRTSSSSTRVELSSSTNSLRVLKSGTLRVSLDDDDLSFYNTSGALLGYVTTPTSSNFSIVSTNGNFLILNSLGTNAQSAVILQINNVNKFTVTNTLNTSNVNLSMSNNTITSVWGIRFASRTIGASSLNAGELAYHDTGSVFGLRTRVGSFNGQVDLSVF